MKNRMTLRPCTCEHEFQDARYGKGRRVHNAMHGDARGAQTGKVVGWRCTVCGRAKAPGVAS